MRARPHIAAWSAIATVVLAIPAGWGAASAPTSDRLDVAAEQMRVARAAADAILEAAGIRLEWRDCAAGCPHSPAAREIVLRLARAPRSTAAGSLGYSVIDPTKRSGTLATVFVDRIASAADRTGADRGLLLGRAIAHEIGHLLLGTSQHADRGLMRARWTDRELRRDSRADWTLSSDIVAALVRRDQDRLLILLHATPIAHR